jgi:hypothetical protein
VKRRDLTLAPAYTDELVNKYNEPAKRIMGVNYASDTTAASLKTRLHTWTVQVAGLAEVNALQQEHRDDLARAAAVQRFYREAGLSGHAEFLALGASCAPWTGVNNCTGTLQDAHVKHYDILKPKFEFDGFEPGEDLPPTRPEDLRRGDPVTVAEEVAFLEKQLCQELETWNYTRQAQRSNCENSPRL